MTQCKDCGGKISRRAERCKPCSCKSRFKDPKKNPNWKGGRTVKKEGVLIYVGKKKYELEHRIVMAKKIGRPLKKDEQVRHRDGNKENNIDENLKLLSPYIDGKTYKKYSLPETSSPIRFSSVDAIILPSKPITNILPFNIMPILHYIIRLDNNFPLNYDNIYYL